MIRLTDEQWERIRDHFPEETIIRSVIESRFSASVKGSFGQPLNSRQIHYEGSRDPQAQPPFGLPHYASPVGASWMWTLALWGIMRIGRRHTAMQQHARTRWRHSQKAGGGNKAQRFRRAELTGSRRGTLSRIEYGKLKRNHA